MTPLVKHTSEKTRRVNKKIFTKIKDCKGRKMYCRKMSYKMVSHLLPQ